MDLYLPIAGNSVNIVSIVGLGGLVGISSGMFGVGGGFLMTPLLIMLGVPPTVAAASDSNQIVGASSSGALAHYRLGNVDMKMAFLLLTGGITGGSIGVRIIQALRALGNADFLIQIAYVVILGGVGSFMFVESLQGMRKREDKGDNTEAPPAPTTPSLYKRLVQKLPWQVHFKHSGIHASVLLPFLLGVFVGTLAAIMGVGGGFIMVPAMVYLLGMPIHVTVGTDLFQIIFTSFSVTVLQAWQNNTVDILLALMLFLGSAFGAQIGTRIGKKLQADQLKILLACIVLIVMCKMVYELFSTPDILLGYVKQGGH